MDPLRIRQDDPASDGLRKLLREHLEHMRRITPPGHVHAMDPEALQGPGLTFWSAWHDESPVGCGALRELAASSGEVKAMRTVAAWRGRGVGSRILEHIVAEAGRRAYRVLYLETGASSAFAEARAFYRRHGFGRSGPFGDYRDDPNSAFMALRIAADGRPAGG